MGVRVLFTGPNEEHEPGTPPVGLLSLELFGSGPTAVTTSTQPARLIFSSRYIESGRQPSGGFSNFATLDGNIRLSPSRAPEFKSTGAPAFTGEVPATDINVEQAELLLKGGGASVVLSNNEGFVVPLPTPPPRARFLEVGVELEIAGTVEATKDVNDRLDIRAFRAIKVQLEDSEGEPVPFEAFEVRGSRRQKVSGKLDDKGEARVQGIAGTHCQVVFPNLQQEAVESVEPSDEEEEPAAGANEPSATAEAPPASDNAPAGSDDAPVASNEPVAGSEDRSA